MTKHHHDQAHGHQHQTKSQGLHKDWRTWVVVLLMLVGMAAYILSDDEALQPDGGDGQQVPAMAE